ncbi:MAG: hypothetical protein FWG83_02320 [Oscillospiraceae bacterium]|nr:hypothetical protein [Oscillospiraceae bacterium]
MKPTNNSKSITDYMNEALNMAKRSGYEGGLSIPEPEPVPVYENKQEKSLPMIPNEEEFSFEGFEDMMYDEFSNESGEGQGEVLPEKASEESNEPETKPDMDFLDTEFLDTEFLDTEFTEEPEETPEEKPEKGENQAANKSEKPEKDGKGEGSQTAATPPSFDDYISRRNRSWEQGASHHKRSTNQGQGGKRA